MRFEPYVLNHENAKIPVEIVPMSEEDAKATDTEPLWQTSWQSDFIQSERFEKYAVKNKDELLALGAYEIQKNLLVVHIAYIESQPESNPNFTKNKKYTGLGRLLIAFGIKLSIDHGFGGDVVLEAKTTELECHYIRDFGAVRLPSFQGAAPKLLISDQAAKCLFFGYLN